MKPSKYGGFYDPRPGAYGPHDPGGGDWNPRSEIRDWWADALAAADAPPKIEYRTVTMVDVLEHWSAAECDLHEVFGVDVEDRVLMEARSWRWLEVRLRDLINRGPRLALALRAS